jgi:hypothetical protein
MRSLSPSGAPGDLTRLKISGPADLVAVVPFLLSFHPHESLVAVLIASGRVVVTARLDLPPAAGARRIAMEFGSLADRQGADEVVVIAYSSDAAHARGVLGELIDEMSGTSLSDAIYVDGHRWWSLTCHGSCCPPEGRRYEVETHPLAAEAVFAGLAVRADREQLRRLAAGPDPADLDPLVRRAAELASEVAASGSEAADLVETTVGDALGAGERPSTDTLLRLALLCRQILVRDRAWALMERPTAHQHVQLWADVVAVTPPELAAAPVCLLGVAAWINGDGALLNICLDRIAAVDPTYTLGHLLADISERALPPTFWDEWVVDLRETLGLRQGAARLV